MTHKHINMIYPQWQGGADKASYHGAAELVRLYLDGEMMEHIPVSTEEAVTEREIFGYADIRTQMEQAFGLLRREQPDTVFTMGGGCDACVPAVSYLNARLDGKLSLLWVDAHGDLNTPESSDSKHFHGMPLRLMLGEGDSALLRLVDKPLTLSQVALAGTRDLDAPERAYIEKHRIDMLTPDMLEDSGAVVELLKRKGNEHLYLHIDMDVLEPSLFPHVPLPVRGGLSPDALIRLVRALSGAFTIPGLSVVEYSPSGGQRFEVLEEITRIGTGLAKGGMVKAGRE